MQVSTAGDDGSVRVWDLGGTGTPEKIGHEDSCMGVSYLPYGDKVVTVGQEGTMKLWDGKEGLFEKQVSYVRSTPASFLHGCRSRQRCNILECITWMCVQE